MMDGASPRIELLLQRLVAQAGELQIALTSRNWDAVEPVQDEFDAQFAVLRQLVEGRTLCFAPEHADDLQRLHEVQSRNEQLARELQAQAQSELHQLAAVRRIGAYAPLGEHHQPMPQYVDGAA